MTFNDDINKRLEYILDNPDQEISFGNDDFTISDLERTDSGIELSYSPFLQGAAEYEFDDFEELCLGIRKIYSYYGKAGVPKRLLEDLEEAID